MKKSNWRRVLRRVLNLVFSRLVITVVLVLLQAFWLFAVFNWLSEYAQWISRTGLALSVIMCLALIRQDSTVPEFKISWMILFMLMPVQSGLLYLLWGNKRPVFGLRRRLERAGQAMDPTRRPDPAAEEQLEKADPRAAMTAKYLHDYAPAPVCSGTAVKYYPDGQSMFADMLPALRSAEHSIYVESFIIGMGEMWGQIHEILRQKAAAGLDVRVIYDDAGCLSLLPHNYAEILQADGIRAFSFNRCVPVLNLVMNNRDHRKIMVIDGKIGFTGGVNLADEYINKLKRFGYWKDSGVRLEGPGATSLAGIFLTFWKAKYPDEEIDPARDLPEVKPQETDCLVQPFADSPVDREAVAKNTYLELINQAQKRLYICTPYLILDNDLLSCLRLAAKRGVDVRIYTPGVPDKPTIYQLTRSYFPHLLRAGVKIYSYTPGFLHAKTWLMDDRIAAVGTVNLDYRSLYLHFENSVLIYGGAVLDDVRRDLAEIERESAAVTLADCRTGFFGTMYSAVLRLVAPLC
ncbi:cardiolipin synthase [Gemmiger formicilis]|uniref:cardiolipin synthase n=2 Tax=Gemmiger TaxID=204475 RepID=UPI00210E6462|nr:cardiolipin synthase [Gemmiger formicilis]MCQ5079787.1 cardiolipin synthase [Gemmiger formicilis]MCQ5115611.1 cardiolipin synthase [Gemmiger formicilis]